MNASEKVEFDERQRILEKEVGVIGHRMNSTEEILKEIKNVLVEQNKSILGMVKIQERQHTQEREIDSLRKDIAAKYAITEPLLDNFKTTVAKVSGFVAASIFFMAIIQGIIGYMVTNAFERLERVETVFISDKVNKND